MSKWKNLSVVSMLAVAAMMLSPIANAQQDGGPGGRGPGRFGGGDPRQRRPMQQNMMGRQQPQQTAPMAVAAGNLYIIVGTEIKRFDARTLEEKATASIPTTDPEQEKRVQDAMMQRFDKNGDGEVTKDEVGNDQIFQRLDTNADGKVTAAEMPAARVMKRPTGPATLLVSSGAVFVFMGSRLCRFHAESLELEASTTIKTPNPFADRMKGGMKGGMMGGQKGGRDRGGMKRRPDQGGNKPGADRDPPPPPPEEPVRF